MQGERGDRGMSVGEWEDVCDFSDDWEDVEDDDDDDDE